MLGQRIGQAGTATDRHGELMHDIPHRRIIHLLFENRQALEHGKTRRSHRAEHSGKAGNVLGFNAGADLDFNFHRFAFDAFDHQVLSAKQGFRFILVLGFNFPVELVSLGILRLV